jgi:hypothetical protein
MAKEAAANGTTPAPGQYKRAPNFDPGFRPAVEEGYLTVQQAVQRGNRRVLATRLQQRHGISEHQALLVADNRVSIGEIMQEREAAAAAAPASPKVARAAATRTAAPSTGKPRAGRARMVVSLLLILAGTGAVGLLGWNRWQQQVDQSRAVAHAESVREARQAENRMEASPEPAPADPKTAVRRGTEVLTNEFGQVTRVSAPDPRSALESYCAAVPGLDPLGVEDAPGAATGVRLGILRDMGRPQHHLAIRLKRDHRTGRWGAGDGTTPLEPTVAR